MPLGTERKAGSVYHFLLGDQGMAQYGHGNEGKPIKAMAKGELDLIKDWRKEFCAPVDDLDWQSMVGLSDAIDKLWNSHANLQSIIRARTTDPLAVYGKPLADHAPGPTTTAEKDATFEQLRWGVKGRAASPYRRLKLAMDYWCALWFWPMEKADLLPDREEFLTDLSLLLEFGMLQQLAKEKGKQATLFGGNLNAKAAQQLAADLGEVDVDKVIARSPRLQCVEELAERYRFLHWELEFADVFQERGGFDVMLGNPPWIKIKWTESDLLGDADPSFVLKKLSSTQTAQRRDEALKPEGRQSAYMAGHEGAAATQAFLTATQNYPQLQGIQPNLYKCFLPLVWAWTSEGGVSGLLHPEGVYDDPKGGGLRGALYPQLRRHYQFVNELNLFVDVDHHAKFSINIAGPPRRFPKFVHLANLFTPSTIDDSHCHHSRGAVPGIKEHGNWEVEGHGKRIVNVGPKELKLFAAVYDSEGITGAQARLPAIHSRQLVDVLECFRDAPRTLADVDDWMPHDMWHESRSRKLGIIDRAEPAVFPEDPSGLILSGPHFFVGNPHYKSPRAVCTNNSHYDCLLYTSDAADE